MQQHSLPNCGEFVMTAQTQDAVLFERHCRRTRWYNIYLSWRHESSSKTRCRNPVEKITVSRFCEKGFERETCGINSFTESDTVGVHSVISDAGNFSIVSDWVSESKSSVSRHSEYNGKLLANPRARSEIPCTENKQEFRTRPREQDKTVSQSDLGRGSGNPFKENRKGKHNADDVLRRTCDKERSRKKRIRKTAERI